MNDAYQALLEEELKAMLEEKSYLVSRYEQALEVIIKHSEQMLPKAVFNSGFHGTPHAIAKRALER